MSEKLLRTIKATSGEEIDTRIGRTIKKSLNFYAVTQIENRKTYSKQFLDKFFKVVKDKARMNKKVVDYFPIIRKWSERIL